MPNKLRLWGPALAVASAVCLVSSCAKKAETTSPAPSSSAQSSPQPTASPAGGTPDKMASEPATPAPTAATPPDATPTPAPEPAPPPPPPPMPATFTIPAGASLSVRTISSLSTKTNKTGEPFTGTLAAPLVVNGVTIARTGSNVNGTIVDSDSGGRVKGVAALRLGITSITTVDHQTVRVSVSPVEFLAKTTKKKDAVKIGGAAAVGTVIGAIAGGGKGAAIGALAGGGAGTGVVLATKGAPAVVPSESLINAHLASDVTVTERQPGTIANRKKAAAMAPVEGGEPPPPPQPPNQ